MICRPGISINRAQLLVVAGCIFLICCIIYYYSKSTSGEVVTRVQRQSKIYRIDTDIPHEIVWQDRPPSKHPAKRLLAPEVSVAKNKVEQEEERIKEHIIHIPDYRSIDCKARPRHSDVPATIIIDFFDYSYYDMKVTLSSVRQYTDSSLIRDVIIVDDGSTLQYIIDEAIEYVSQMSTLKMTLIRNEYRRGQAYARMRAARDALGSNLVFLDPQVIVNAGWLQPLLQHLQGYGNAVAVPHIDNVNDPIDYNYIKTPDTIGYSFTWDLKIRSMLQAAQLKSDFYVTSMMRGNIFAVTRDHFRTIHGLDEELSDGGGEALEFSFRNWMCGGEIHIVSCSRVGVLRAKEDIVTSSSVNVWRITQLWLPEYQYLVEKHLGHQFTSEISNANKASLLKRKTLLQQNQCLNFTWFLKNIAKDFYQISPDAVTFGSLQVKNGYCARIGKDLRIDLGSCNADGVTLLRNQMIFELTSDGKFKCGGSCLTVTSTFYAVVESCRSDDRQVWIYQSQQLLNKATSFCLTHVTDPDSAYENQHRQIAMAQGCSSDKKDLDFNVWTFQKP